MLEVQARRRLHGMNQEAFLLRSAIVQLHPDGNAIGLMELLDDPVVQGQPLVLLDRGAELRCELLVAIGIDGDSLGEVVGESREMFGGFGVGDWANGQDADRWGTALFESVAEEAVVAMLAYENGSCAHQIIMTYIDLGQQSAYPGSSGISSFTPVARINFRPFQTLPTASVASNSPESSFQILRKATSASVTVL